MKIAITKLFLYNIIVVVSLFFPFGLTAQEDPILVCRKQIHWRDQDKFYFISESKHAEKQYALTLNIRDFKDLKPISAIKLEMNLSPALKKVIASDWNAVAMLKDKDGYAIIYDLLGTKLIDGTWLSINDYGGYKNAFRRSFLVAQKYSSDFKPVGEAISLMDRSIATMDNFYETRLLFNQDSSQIALFQSSENMSTIFGRDNKAKLFILDRSFKKVKEFEVNTMLRGESATLRDMIFCNGKISIVVSDILEASRGPAKNKSINYLLEINTTTDKVDYFPDDQYLSDNNLKPKFFQILPVKGNPVVVALVANRNYEKDWENATGFQVMEAEGGKLKKQGAWELDVKERHTSKEGAFSFSDVNMRGNMEVLPMKDNKGFYVVARNGLGNNGGHKKDWRYFFVMTFDARGKMLKQQFFPIHVTPRIAFTGVFYKVIDDNLIVAGNFNEAYYTTGIQEKKPKEKTAGILKISPDLKATLIKIEGGQVENLSDVFYMDSKEVIGKSSKLEHYHFNDTLFRTKYN